MNGIFRGKTHGTVTVGERGQIVIPAALRKEFKIKPGDQLMVFSKPERKIVSLIHLRDLNSFLERAEKALAKLGSKVLQKR